MEDYVRALLIAIMGLAALLLFPAYIAYSSGALTQADKEKKSN
jgi:hypothetical protein